LLTANTAKDGTGTVATLYTAGVNGSKLNSVQIAYTGTSTATVLRLFINNGSVNSTPANNSLYMSITVAANTLSEVAAAADITQALSLTLPAGYKLLATIGTTVAAALHVTASGGDL
jgi:enamine deaminase RidA (YjgF/YER057c/UK114 family)